MGDLAASTKLRSVHNFCVELFAFQVFGFSLVFKSVSRVLVHRFFAFMILLIASRIVLLSEAAAQPISIQVPVSDPWYDTGIDILSGQRLTILARGGVKYGSGLPQNADANGVGAQ